MFNFLRKPLFARSNSARLGLRQPYTHPVTSVFGSAGFAVKRTMITEAPAALLAGNTVIMNTFNYNGGAYTFVPPTGTPLSGKNNTPTVPGV